MGRKVQFFGVKYGRKPGVYNDWTDCKVQIIGLSSAKWRRFSTHAEAHQYCFSGPKDEQSKLFIFPLNKVTGSSALIALKN